MSALEEAVRIAWVAWGEYGKATICSGCGEVVYCRAKRQRGPWLCIACFDQAQ